MIKKTKFQLNKKVFGIGRIAFSRIIPTFFFKDYGVICHRESSENSQLKNFFKLFYFPQKKEKIIGFLRNFDNKGWLIPYKSTDWLEEICQEIGWQMMANKTSLRKFFENKKNFRKILLEIGIEAIRGESLIMENLDWTKIENLQKKYGKKIVLQLSETKVGAGSGTFFIERQTDFERFLEKSKEGNCKFVNVLEFIKGIPAAIYGCVSKKGVLTSRLYAMLIDIKEALSPGQKNGVYCGQDFSFFNNSPKINKKASLVVKKIGRFLAKKGYRGIFGVDFIVDREKGKLYPTECNPRYCGSFPTISLF